METRIFIPAPGAGLRYGTLRARAWFVVWSVAAACAIGCGSKPPYEGKSEAQLERMLHDSDPAVQTQGAFGLSLLGPEARPAVPALIEALDSPNALVRQNAALALGSIGPDARGAVEGLTKLLHDEEWSVRRQAAMSLGKIGPDARSAEKALNEARNDPRPLVRSAAEEALKKMQRSN
jgi:HEAT repeat protein